jgi:hypothetical protein
VSLVGTTDIVDFGLNYKMFTIIRNRRCKTYFDCVSVFRRELVVVVFGKGFVSHVGEITKREITMIRFC